MLNNKTRDTIKKHFKNPISRKAFNESYEKDFTEQGIIDDYITSSSLEMYDNFDKIVNYRYVGDEFLDLTEIKLKGSVRLVLYCINDNLFKPYLFMALEKHRDKLRLPEFTLDKAVEINKVHKTVKKEFFSGTETKIDYQGYYKDKDEDQIYLFYKTNVNEEEEARKIELDEIIFYATIDEIINQQVVYDFPVEKSVVDFFTKNDAFCYLEDEDFNLIETPIIAYTGGYYKRIAITAALGRIRGTPYASMGPYFYFSSYKRAMRYGVLTVNGKPQEVNGIRITRDDSPVYEKGGIVKFVLFMGKEKVFLNRDNDEEDTSEISKIVAKDSEIVALTMKNRDSDANWVKEYDSTIITYKEIDFRGSKRELEPQFTIQHEKQCMPISYFYVNTDDVMKSVEEKDGIKMYDYMKAVRE